MLIPNQYCSPHFEWMVEDAMCQAGFYAEALQRMKQRYQSQVDNEWQTTLYEMFPKGGTYNHAWNAPNTILAKHIAGIRPTEPAWSEYQVEPQLQHLSMIRQNVPSVKGDIKVEMHREPERFVLLLQSPPETTAMIGIPKSFGPVKQISVDGHIVWNDGVVVDGDRGVTFADEDARFITFRVPPGDWSFVATIPADAN
ncbi:alpha-L-rhamnosidase [Rhodopirellula sallentina SM41]|uniref:Alpha-L-rhamnosidase n=1 Tax=Rhodopirellula sallentina SM41 TaxID=1263870 RepID=M5U7C3_9BACT|nr:alpha-L-rhamnosidase [Rhodopirellula sallentina SM41]